MNLKILLKLSDHERLDIVTRAKALQEPTPMEGDGQLPMTVEVENFILKHFPSFAGKTGITFQDLLNSASDAELIRYQNERLTINEELFKPLDDALKKLNQTRDEIYQRTGKLYVLPGEEYLVGALVSLGMFNIQSNPAQGDSKKNMPKSP